MCCVSYICAAYRYFSIVSVDTTGASVGSLPSQYILFDHIGYLPISSLKGNRESLLNIKGWNFCNDFDF